MAWKRLFGKHDEHRLVAASAGGRRRNLMTAGSCVAGLPPPIRLCKAVSTHCASAGTWPRTTWSGRWRHGSQRIPGASAWNCSTARWRRSKTICARSMRPRRCLRFRFPRRRSRTSRSGWKSRSASPSRSDRNDFAGKRRSTGTSAAGRSCAGRSCSAPEMPPRSCRPRSRTSDAENWSGISPRAPRSSRSIYATAPSTASRYPERPTLADLARPCPVCGDWLDWRGHCDTCATRAYRRQTLRAEAARLAQERDDEEEDRHKWSERFPVARKRLADLDADIARLEAR